MNSLFVSENIPVEIVDFWISNFNVYVRHNKASFEVYHSETPYDPPYLDNVL